MYQGCCSNKLFYMTLQHGSQHAYHLMSNFTDSLHG